MPKEEGNVGSGESNDSPTLTVEIDGETKVIKADDVKNLLAQQASVTQKAQKIAAIEDAARKYGLDPEDYVSHAEGSFATLAQLMELGLVNDKGEPIATKKDDVTPTTPARTVTPTTKQPDESVAKALDSLSKMQKRLETLEEDQTRMMRISLGKEIRAKHPELSDDDVSRVFGTAMNDNSKSVWQHAEAAVKAKASQASEAEKRFAEKYGIDLEAWNANKVREQAAEGGASVVAAGREIKFGHRIRGKDGGKAITPKQAMQEFFANQAARK